MSENLDLVRSIYADWERGDWCSFDFADPEIELEIVDGRSPASVTDVGATARAWPGFMSVWENLGVEASECREINDESVQVLTDSSGRLKRSQTPVPEEWTRGAAPFHTRSGKVVRLIICLGPDRALADLGLEE